MSNNTTTEEADSEDAEAEEESTVEINQETDQDQTGSESTGPATLDAIVEAGYFQELIGSVSTLVDECKIHLNESAVQIKTVDPANVAMANQFLSADAFESYEGSGLIGVNVNRLEDIIGMPDADTLLHITIDQSTRKLKIQFNDLDYTLGLIDPPSIRDEPDIPDLDLPANVSMEGQVFNRALTAADMVSDHIELLVDEDNGTFEVIAEGDTDDVHLERDQGQLIDIDVAPADSIYSLDYLQDINKSFDNDTELHLELGEEFPVFIRFSFADGHGDGTYLLAPRISSK